MIANNKIKTINLIKNIYFNKKTPISLIHFITNRCNARCSFCFIDFENENTFKGELTLDEIEKLTKSFGKSLLNVNFTGGEPFARKDIIDIAKIYIRNTTIQSIYVTTNASLPDRIKKFAEEIILYDNDINLTFQISIDDFPEQHNKVRKIDNLFDSCLKTYRTLLDMNKRISPVVSITVTHENCENIKDIFYYLTDKCGVKALKCTIVRDEGVYKTPKEKKEKIYKAYTWLTEKIHEYSKTGKIINYNKNSLQGRLHNKKDQISWSMTKKMYMEPHYISPCHAGSLFGIITANGMVYPCEILEDKFLGDLRGVNMNFKKIWQNHLTSDVKKFIKKTKCNCTYECALTYNILGNWRYQPSLMTSFFDF